MAVTSVTPEGTLTGSDTRRRIMAIVGASSGILLNGLIFMSTRSICFCILLIFFFISGISTIRFCKPQASLPPVF
ncbi:hypothetical protein ACLK1Y_14480 [Escherichia coli]